MFGSKLKNTLSGSGNPSHREIRQHAGSLISIANRAEALSLKGGEPTITNSGEVIMARELLAAQQQLLNSVDTAMVRGDTIADIQTLIFAPVMESSVVGDVAWLMMQNVVTEANKRRPPLVQD